VVSRVGKVIKIRLKHFSAVLTGNDKNCTPNIVGMLGWKMESSGLIFQLCLLQAWTSGVRTHKSHQNSTKTFFSRTDERNDKNYILNTVGKFRVQNQVIFARFLAFPTLVLFGPEKVVKIRPKYFTVVLTGNDKNYTPNIVGMFWEQNGIIRIRFKLCLLQSCSGGVWTRKSHQNLTETFFSCNDERG